MLRALLGALCGLAALLAASGVALAQSDVDEARRLYEEAEFAAASAALDRAEASDSLSREELLRALELRLYLHLATGGQAHMRIDLVRLLSVDPGYQAGDETPPEAAEMLTLLRSELGPALAVFASASLVGSEVHVEASVENDPAELTRDVRVRTRVGSAEATLASRSASVPIVSGDSVAYWAEAIGPGGAVLARHGEASSPLLFPPDGETSVVEGGDDATGWIIFGVVAGLLVAGGAVTLGVFLGTANSGPSENTQPSLPMIAMD